MVIFFCMVCRFELLPNVKEHGPPLAGAHVETGVEFIVRVTPPTERIVAVAVARVIRLFNLGLRSDC